MPVLHRRALLGATAAAVSLSALPAFARVRRADGDAVLDAAVAEKSPVALAGAVVTKDGIAWSGVRGVRRFGQADAATLKDRWHLGSNTKAMTAALYGRLVDQGRARWDAPLVEIFAGVAADPAWLETTILDVMHQRAGLDSNTVMGRPWLMTARADPRTLPEQRRAIVDLALATAPTGTPGVFAYGNANYVILGAAIEAITGKAWEDVMQAELFTPLGIASGGFGAPLHDADGGGNAWGHRGAGDLRGPMDPAGPGADNPKAMGPAGTAHMTLDDYARFIRVFLNDGAGWLKPETVAVLIAPPSEGDPYAGGWGARPQPWANGRALGHDGSNTMWHATASVAPGRGLAFIGVANEGPQNGTPRTLVQGLIGGYAS